MFLFFYNINSNRVQRLMFFFNDQQKNKPYNSVKSLRSTKSDNNIWKNVLGGEIIFTGTISQTLAFWRNILTRNKPKTLWTTVSSLLFSSHLKMVSFKLHNRFSFLCSHKTLVTRSQSASDYFILNKLSRSERCCDITYITPAVHISELVQMCFDGSQVLLLHVAEQALDGQRGHLQGGGGIHGWPLTTCTPLQSEREADEYSQKARDTNGIGPAGRHVQHDYEKQDVEARRRVWWVFEAMRGNKPAQSKSSTHAPMQIKKPEDAFFSCKHHNIQSEKRIAFLKYILKSNFNSAA